jgi:hypothetical protein
MSNCDGKGLGIHAKKLNLSAKLATTGNPDETIDAPRFDLELEAPAETERREERSIVAGLVIGTLGPALVVTGQTVDATKEWQRIGVRIAGSWIVTIPILVLSPSLIGTATLEANVLLSMPGRTV